MFANDDECSSGEENVCAEDYRGPEPFSEPETRALSDFVSNWTNIKVVINLHAFGNLMIVPFNYDNNVNGHLKEDFPLANQFYKHIHENGKLPKGNRMGNGRTTINYTANGEASDYFLAEKGVYSMSPELGLNDKKSQKFFVDSKSELKHIVSKNYYWLHYTMKQLHPSLHFELGHLEKDGETSRTIVLNA